MLLETQHSPSTARTKGRSRECARGAPARTKCPNRAEHVNSALNQANAFLSQRGREKINILKMLTYCSAGGYKSQRWLHGLNAKKALQQRLVCGCSDCCFSLDHHHLPPSVHHPCLLFCSFWACS